MRTHSFVARQGRQTWTEESRGSALTSEEKLNSGYEVHESQGSVRARQVCKPPRLSPLHLGTAIVCSSYRLRVIRVPSHYPGLIDITPKMFIDGNSHVRKVGEREEDEDEEEGEDDEDKHR